MIEPLSDLLIQCEALRRLPWLRHGSTTRLFNSVPGKKNEELKLLADAWGITPAGVLFSHQRHTNNVAFLSRTSCEPHTTSSFIYNNTDAVGTDAENILTCIFTADCVPVFLVDTKERRIMLVHSGWRGALGEISVRALQSLTTYGTDPADVTAWIGPAIGVCCYEVSEKLAGEFLRRFPNFSEAVHGRHLDLKNLNARQLESCGVLAKNIHVSGYCTKCRNDLFYSYRAGDTHGSILSAAVILPDT